MQRRKSGIYEFRKRLPLSLAGLPAPAWLRDHPEVAVLINPNTGKFKRELTVSLQTNDTKLARRRDLAEAKRAHERIDLAEDLLRSGPDSVVSQSQAPSPELSLEAIPTMVVRKLLAENDVEREQGDARRHHQTRAERSLWPDLSDARIATWGMATGHHEVMADEIAMLGADYREAYRERRIEIVQPELHAYLTENDLPIDPKSRKYFDAGMAFLEGYVKGYELLEQRQSGAVVPTPEPVAPEPAKGPVLSEAYKHWSKGGTARGAKQPGANAIREAERAVRYLKDWCGDVALGELTKPMVRDFRDNGLSKIGTRLPIKVRVMPLRKLVATKAAIESEPIHATSVNKYLNLLSAIVTTAERDGLLDDVPGFVNPFGKMALRIDARSDEGRRKPFNPEQLTVFFSDRIYTSGHRPRAGGGEAAYWFPLIGLLTGARLNEITQLRLCDLRKDPESGIWFMDINAESGKQVKTATAVRRVPLHAELIRLGLLEYRDGLAKKKGAQDTDRLWPEVQSEDGVYSATAFTKWFGRYVRKSVGITDSAIVFHSFRHTFKRLCRDALLSEELHDFLTGHSGGASVGRGYGGGFGLRALGEGVQRLSVPEVIRKLSPWADNGSRAQR